MKFTVKGGRLLVVGVALSLIAASCGGDDGSSSSSAPETTEAVAETTAAPSEEPTTTVAGEPAEVDEDSLGPATGEPIKVGTIIMNVALVSPELRLPGLGASVEYINAHGGVNGRPIEWEICYIEGDVTGEQCAQEMVDKGVVATVSDFDPLTDRTWSPILQQAGIPEIDIFTNDPGVRVQDNVFLFGPGTPVEYMGLTQYANILGLTKLHFLIADSASSENSVNAVTPVAESYGMEILGDPTRIALSATDYSPFVASANDSGAEFNVTVIGPFQTEQLLTAADLLGIDGKIALGEGQFNKSQQEQYGSNGGPIEGALLIAPVPPFGAADRYPELQKALDQIQAYYEAGNDVADPAKLTSIATRAWFSMRAFQRVAATITGDITAASMMEALSSPSTSIDLGLDYPWAPGTKGPSGFDQSSNPWLYLSTIENGQVVPYQDEPIDAFAPIR